MSLSERSKPWYSYPLVWMMVAIPFTAVIMGVVMIWLAVDTDDGLVADDYYKQGLAINQVIERDKKAAELGLSAIVEFDNTTRVIKLVFDKGLLDSYPQQLQLHLQHATRANSDVSVVMNRGIDNQYIGNIKKNLTEGIWYFELAEEDWKINARSHVQKKNTIELKSGYQ